MKEILTLVPIAGHLFGAMMLEIIIGKSLIEFISKAMIWENYQWYRRMKGGYWEHWQMQDHIKWTLWTRPSSWPESWKEIGRPALAKEKWAGGIIEAEQY